MQNIFNSIDKVNQQYLYNHNHATIPGTRRRPFREVRRLGRLRCISSVLLLKSTSSNCSSSSLWGWSWQLTMKEDFSSLRSSRPVTPVFMIHFLECCLGRWWHLIFVFKLKLTITHLIVYLVNEAFDWSEVRGSEESESESKYLVKAVPPRPLCVLSPVHCWCPQDQLPVLQTLVTTGGRLWLKAR